MKSVNTYLRTLSGGNKGTGSWVGFLLLLLLLVSCNYTGYDTGDGDYSYVHADYVCMTVRQGVVTDIVTDDDAKLTVPQGLTYSEQVDTVIRRLIYYNDRGDGTPVQILSMRAVSVLQVRDKAEVPATYTDPLTLTAAWMSQNEQWLNMQIGLKVGASEEQAVQTLALRCDSISTERRGAVWLSLCHSQNNMPQYYTEDVRLSIPLSSFPDTIRLKVSTYSGTVMREFVREE